MKVYPCISHKLKHSRSSCKRPLCRYGSLLGDVFKGVWRDPNFHVKTYMTHDDLVPYVCLNTYVTPLKTNMSPENQWLEDVFPTEIVPFLGDMLVFGSVSHFLCNDVFT